MAKPRTAVFLHIGPMKSGTRYLQQLMADNQGHLAGAGILYPGTPPRKAQAQGVQQILKGSSTGGWRRAHRRLATTARRDVGTRGFCLRAFDGVPQLRQVPPGGSDSGVPAPSEVHVLLTLRDASRVLPSAWATSTRNHETTPWPEFAEAAAQGPGNDKALWRRSMRALNVPRMLRVWGGVVPAERLHVVPVPPSGSPSDLLWQRFAAVIGVDPDICSSPRARRNESFGYASAELMRRVNAHVNHLPNRSTQQRRADSAWRSSTIALVSPRSP